MAPQTEAEVFWYLHLTPAEQGLVASLRQALTSQAALLPSLADDISLARFLRARAWDVAKAAKMYVKMGKLRAEHGLERLAIASATALSPAHPLQPQLLHLHPHFYHKTDR